MDIAELRSGIDAIDSELATLFVRRMELCRSIGALKAQTGAPVSDPGREDEILQRLCDNAGVQYSAYVQVLYEKIFELCRALQERGPQS